MSKEQQLIKLKILALIQAKFFDKKEIGNFGHDFFKSLPYPININSDVLNGIYSATDLILKYYDNDKYYLDKLCDWLQEKELNLPNFMSTLVWNLYYWLKLIEKKSK